MPTDYDVIAARYRRAKRQPWRGFVEAFTLLDLIGDVSGRAVVDLACGEGHYTRVFPGLGAARVVGVDRSGGMIALARSDEAARPFGIEYRVRDCADLDLPPAFDLAVAAYLLNYAADVETLAAMAAGVARCLRPGGRFVTINANPDLDFARGASYRRYGFEVRGDSPPRPGMPYLWVLHDDGGPVEVENAWLPRADYEAALRSAGFREVRWHRPRLSPAAGDPAAWADLIDHPPIIAIECRV